MLNEEGGIGAGEPPAGSAGCGGSCGRPTSCTAAAGPATAAAPLPALAAASPPPTLPPAAPPPPPPPATRALADTAAAAAAPPPLPLLPAPALACDSSSFAAARRFIWRRSPILFRKLIARVSGSHESPGKAFLCPHHSISTCSESERVAQKSGARKGAPCSSVHDLRARTLAKGDLCIPCTHQLQPLPPRDVPRNRGLRAPPPPRCRPSAPPSAHRASRPCS